MKNDWKRPFAIVGRHLNAYAQFEGPGSVDQLIEAFRVGIR